MNGIDKMTRLIGYTIGCILAYLIFGETAAMYAVIVCIVALVLTK